MSCANLLCLYYHVYYMDNLILIYFYWLDFYNMWAIILLNINTQNRLRITGIMCERDGAKQG